MKQEIERRFIIDSKRLPPLTRGQKIVQGYFGDGPNQGQPSIRIRLLGNKYFLTIKVSKSSLIRAEFEYPLPASDGEALLKLVPHRVEKTRYNLHLDQKLWQIDVFGEKNSSLLLAEIELNSSREKFNKPLWIKEEVTNDQRFTSHYLAFNPFSTWK